MTSRRDKKWKKSEWIENVRTNHESRRIKKTLRDLDEFKGNMRYCTKQKTWKESNRNEKYNILSRKRCNIVWWNICRIKEKQTNKEA